MSLFERILGQGSPSHGAYRPVATVEEQDDDDDNDNNDKVETARLADLFVSEPQAHDNGKKNNDDDDDDDANYDYYYNYNPKRRLYYGLMIIAIAAFISVQHVGTKHSPDNDGDGDASKLAATPIPTPTTTRPLPDWEQHDNDMAEHSSKSVSTMTHDGSVIYTDTDPTTMIFATSAMTSTAAATTFITATTTTTIGTTTTSTTTSEDDTTTSVATTTTTREQVSTEATTPATAVTTNKENMIGTSTLDTNETIATAQSTTPATETSTTPVESTTQNSIPTTATAESIATTTQSITQTATPPASTESTTSETTITEEATTDTQSTTQSTTTTTMDTATLSTTSTVATTTMTTAATTALSLQERYEYMREPDDHDIEFLRQPKATPSGWWPNRAWVRTCATKVRDNLTPFATWPEWEDYRLGDCVKLCRGCPAQRGHDALANWTLAGEYYDLACPPHGFLYQKRGNETLLDELVDAREGTPGFVKPNPEAVVVHLRLGDKVEWAKADVFTILQNAANPYDKSFQGMHALKSVYEFLTDIVTSEATQVVIRGGSQLPNLYVKSKTYAYCIQEAVEMAGYNVTMNLDKGNADRDFFFLSHARKIIVTLGGYSRFVGHAVLRRGGIVYGRLFR